MKHVQISEELFARLYAYFVFDRRDDTQESIITQELEDKMNRIIKHNDYTLRIVAEKDFLD